MTARDIVMGAAGNSGDSKTYIEDVFSTYLYGGAGTIINGIDLAGKGGMVWLKNRLTGSNHSIHDTNRIPSYQLSTNLSAAENTIWGDLSSFNNNGFTIGTSGGGNNTGSSVASWTFRKAPKFFDVVTWTGDGSGDARQISHSLGQVPGMIIVKHRNDAQDWVCYHRSLGATKSIALNLTTTPDTWYGYWNNTEPTSSSFTAGSWLNTSGQTYVAYLFAHDTTTDGLIQCGSFTTDASGNVPNINLGWEPQYLLTKSSSATGNWNVVDTMRGWTNDGSYGLAKYLQPNLSNAEANTAWVTPTATGFTSPDTLVASTTYIYMAIRRGPMRTPTDGTKVFLPTARVTGTGTVTTGFPVDTLMSAYRSGGTGYYWGDRIRGGGKALVSANTNAETAGTAPTLFTSNTSYSPNPDWFYGGGGTTQTSEFAFRRAPGFFDVVCYTGTGSLGRTINHNLGVIPEMVIVKYRSGNSPDVDNWVLRSGGMGTNTITSGNYIVGGGLDTSYAAFQNNGYFNASSFTNSLFALSSSQAYINTTACNYVAYLFASCPGVSKVFAFTGNGSSQTINCGFTGGARLVLIKRTDNTGDWYVWDTARGIIAGSDPHLSLNTTAAEVTSDDTIDPDSTGFIVNQVTATNVNVNGASYIGLAIA